MMGTIPDSLGVFSVRQPRPAAVALALFVVFPALVAVLGALRGTVFATSMPLADRLLLFLGLGLPTWWVAALVSAAAWRMLPQTALAGRFGLALAAGAVSVILNYFFLGWFLTTFDRRFAMLAGLVDPDAARLRTPLGDYLAGFSAVHFMLVWSTAIGLYLIATARHAAPVRPANTAAIAVESPMPRPDIDPPFLGRTDPAIGRDLIMIAAQEHYLRVVTRKGADLIHYRFSDAVGELIEWPGLQVHRSFWVARDAIESFHASGRRLRLRLITGAEVPVSVSHRAIVERECRMLERGRLA